MFAAAKAKSLSNPHSKGESDGKRWPWNHMNVMMAADACSIATRNEAAIPDDQTSPSLKLQTDGTSE
ncbi:hypothetical protein V6N11_012465 [Hibiscus sabdariffa]|uniref:Uncharacterized protein n=1 Tax=Hibiscus sabdariffa TaxID=183260 RepID=A0ABR2QBA9_9ROSI